VGALQVTVAWYAGGRRPDIDCAAMESLLQGFGEAHALGAPRNCRRAPGDPSTVSGDFAREDEFIRAWYVTNGADLAFFTYTALGAKAPQHRVELEEADLIVRSTSFPAVAR
jgi:hypothetical protein